MTSNIYVGTSGWHYRHWVGIFYPEGMPGSDFLDYYKTYFKTVEINNTFYRMPKESTVDYWRVSAPEDFIFSVKASRYLTHIKKLKGPSEGFNEFLQIISRLGDHLGPVLFQLPPKWGCDIVRLKSFVSKLTKEYRYAFEFRNADWFNHDVYQILIDHNIAFCIYDFNRQRSPMELTADFVYVRLHGPEGAYQGSYDRTSLSQWAVEIKTWRDSGKSVYCYFDNDQKGFAVRNAMTLIKMLEES
ncbi:MAG: DUF72 domain-containing protein [Candidatus Omnitrophota bacterium]